MPDTNKPAQPPHLVPEGSSFRWHGYLYRVLQPGQDFLEADGFSSYAATVERIRSSGKPVILSVGESSTSGWDTTVTPENRSRKAQGLAPISAFFRYRNYTDMVREKIGDRFEVVNAGIPGHTVLSGIRRLQLLSNAFRKDGIRFDYVLIHFGNNDCLWENNFQDRYHLYAHPRSSGRLEYWRRKLHPVRKDGIVLRTAASDFGRYFRKLISMTRKLGAPAIIVQPEIPLYWKPGTRYVEFDYDAMALQPGGREAIASMYRAREIWEAAISQPYSAAKVAQLTAAAELDFIVPRIKQGHLAELQKAATSTGTPLVQTPIPRDEDEKNYFVDYCHPREIINERIATQIVGHIDAFEQARGR